MAELHNVINNHDCAACNVGSNLMLSGEIATLAVLDYSCSDSFGVTTCSNVENMLGLSNLAGGLHCETDRGGCVLDGLHARRGMYITGVDPTSGAPFTVRGLTVYRGQSTMGGGIELTGGAKVELVLCRFLSCLATQANRGGGAIFMTSR